MGGADEQPAPPTEPLASRVRTTCRVGSERGARRCFARTAAALVATIGLVLALAGTASAHPLGNFTTNHYAGVELVGRQRRTSVYVLDLAEIPTFQARSGSHARAGQPTRRPVGTIAAGLQLEIDGVRRPLDAARAHSLLPCRRRGPEDDPARARLRRRSRRAGPAARAHDPRRHLRGPSRLARDRDPAPSAARVLVVLVRAEGEPVSDRSAPIPVTFSRARSTSSSALARVEAGDDAGVAPLLERPRGRREPSGLGERRRLRGAHRAAGAAALASSWWRCSSRCSGAPHMP